MKDQAEVCSLSRGMMLQSLSTLLLGDLRFFRYPLPAISSASLAVAYHRWKISGLPCLEKITEWVRSALFAGGVGVHERAGTKASTRHFAFWLKLKQHL